MICYPFLCDREQQDVYETVEWVAKQPWSNGKVALYGYSYSAITSLLGAAKQPPRWHVDGSCLRRDLDREAAHSR